MLDECVEFYLKKWGLPYLEETFAGKQTFYYAFLLDITYKSVVYLLARVNLVFKECANVLL